nr:MAG TPA: hypothetical protein [Inoviridae sp.]
MLYIFSTPYRNRTKRELTLSRREVDRPTYRTTSDLP